MGRPFKSPWIFSNIAIQTAAGNSSFANEQGVIVKKTSGQATTVTLPPPPGAPLVNQAVLVIDGKGDAATNNITVQGAAAATIDGAASVVMSTNYGAAAFMWNGTEWNVLWTDNWNGANLTIPNGGNIILATGTGTQIGTNSSQKLGFYGATPVIRPSGTGELLGFIGNGATNANAVNFASNGNSGPTFFSHGDVVKALKAVGILTA